MPFDAEAEARRLAGLYAGMLEGEVLALAEKAYELTDIAKPILQAEMAKRGLKEELKTSAAPPEATEHPDELPVPDDAAEREAELPGEEHGFSAACPACKSPEILFEGDGAWSCDACGHVWKDAPA